MPINHSAFDLHLQCNYFYIGMIFLMESAFKVEAVLLYHRDFPVSKVLSNQSFLE